MEKDIEIEIVILDNILLGTNVSDCSNIHETLRIQAALELNYNEILPIPYENNSNKLIQQSYMDPLPTSVMMR